VYCETGAADGKAIMATTGFEAVELATSHAPAAKSSRHVASLDGLRALAILAVMAVHAGVPGASVGWLGVDLFFVLSGFLITSLLAGEFARSGRISLARFWGRRFLRLMPAYWVYAAALTAAITLFHWGRVQPHGGWTVGSYIASLWLYFVNYVPQGGIWEHQWLSLHLWSLAVEEQFYFVWPIICLLALRLGRPSWVAWGLVALVMIRRMSIAGDDPHLDTRGLGITVGCALALSLRESGATSWRRGLGMAPSRILIVVATATVIVVATYCQTHGFGEPVVHRAILPVIVPLFALLVAMLWYGPNDRISRALSWKPLVFIGTISYGMYLYHMFSHFLTWHVLTSGLEDWPRWPKFGLRLLIYFATTLGISAFSYQFLEQPFLRLKARLAESPPIDADRRRRARLAGSQADPADAGPSHCVSLERRNGATP
jgi:peptidoglycan/LPS O-acetylase OafA/YrhL